MHPPMTRSALVQRDSDNGVWIERVPDRDVHVPVSSPSVTDGEDRPELLEGGRDSGRGGESGEARWLPLDIYCVAKRSRKGPREIVSVDAVDTVAVDRCCVHKRSESVMSNVGNAVLGVLLRGGTTIPTILVALHQRSQLLDSA